MLPTFPVYCEDLIVGDCYSLGNCKQARLLVLPPIVSLDGGRNSNGNIRWVELRTCSAKRKCACTGFPPPGAGELGDVCLAGVRARHS